MKREIKTNQPAWPLLLLAGIGLIGLPLVGCFLAGHPLGRYLEFPPRTHYVAHAPFSAWAFFCFTVFVLLVVGLLVVGGRRQPAPTRRSAPFLKRRSYFIRLFFISAGFWWFFEYLNRFVQNWFYTGSHYPPLTYFILATLSFSTVSDF